eukprot:scaffold66091_cov35-Phaeocystis_antarctica.AAC.1
MRGRTQSPPGARVGAGGLRGRTHHWRLDISPGWIAGGQRRANKCKSYRPVSVTPMEYRVMMKAVQLKLQGAVEAVLGRTQMAHMWDGRYAHDNTILLAEAARKLEAAGQSGVALMLDNSAAFDRGSEIQGKGERNYWGAGRSEKRWASGVPGLRASLPPSAGDSAYQHTASAGPDGGEAASRRSDVTRTTRLCTWRG